jgi:hypothetical protein
VRLRVVWKLRSHELPVSSRDGNLASPAGRAVQATFYRQQPTLGLGGATGLEPATPRTTTLCANRLRHAPHGLTPGRIRTSGQRLRRPLLCPLSYGRMATLQVTREFPREHRKTPGISISRAISWLASSNFTHSANPWTRRTLRVACEFASNTTFCQSHVSVGDPRHPFEITSTYRLHPAQRETGIEPASLAWKARALPLSYSRAESERPDSNRRPQRPERCALTKLRHSPLTAERA